MLTEEDNAPADRDIGLLDEEDIPFVNWIDVFLFMRFYPESLCVSTCEEREQLPLLTTVFPHLSRTGEDQIADGGGVVYRRFRIFGPCAVPWRGLPATGKQETCTLCSVRRIKPGQVVEDWFTHTIGSFVRQPGLKPFSLNQKQLSSLVMVFGIAEDVLVFLFVAVFRGGISLEAFHRVLFVFRKQNV